MESQEMEDQKPHICGTCFQVFDSEDLLKIHDQLCINKRSDSKEMEDTEEKPKICETFCLVLELEESYQEHKSACSEQKPIGQVEMESDVEFKNNDSKLHVCSICKIVFNSEDSWRNHSISCSEKKPFVCEVCHLEFKDEDQMNQHKEEIHETEHRFYADIMNDFVKYEPEDDKSEVQCSNVDNGPLQKFISQHRTQTRKKLHQCDVCNKSFNKTTHLNIHYRIHTG